MIIHRNIRFCRAAVIRSHTIAGTVLLAAAWLLVGGANAAQAECTTSICGASPCTITGSHTIDASCLLDFGSKDVTVSGTLNGDANGSLCYTIKAHNLTVSGTGTLRAHNSCVTVNITGNFAINSGGTVDVASNVTTSAATITAAGTVTLNGTTDASGSAGNWGGNITITGASVLTGTGAIRADGGAGGGVGGNVGGTITITSTSGDISHAGNISANAAGTGDNYGGSVTIDSHGGLTVGTSTKTIEAKGTNDSFGGDIVLIARGGTATVNGALNVNDPGLNGYGGTIGVTGTSISTGTSWAANGDQGGNGGSITVIATAGTVTTTAGAFNAFGGYSASTPGYGGSIDVEATGSITLAGNMDAGGNGAGAHGGDIKLLAGNTSASTLTIQSAAYIRADSSGTGATDGTIKLSGCNVTLAGTADTRNTNLSKGTNTIVYRGNFTTNAGSSLLADSVSGGFGGNNVDCRCVDANADNVCDAPARCVNNPTFSGTVTPSATYTLTAEPACS